MLRKKALVITAAALLLGALALFQGIAVGAIGSTYTQITDAKFTALGINFKPSNNVQVMFIDDNATKPQLYTICSKNTSGDTVYATSNLSTNIYYKNQKDDSTNLIPGKALSDVVSTVMSGIAAGESINWGSWHTQ